MNQYYLTNFTREDIEGILEEVKCLVMERKRHFLRKKEKNNALLKNIL